MMPKSLLAAVLLCLTTGGAAPTTQPAGGGVGRFPGMEVDLAKHELRLECESLNPHMPLEFFCVLNGTSEHESVLRTAVRPMHLHTGLLMLGAKPGAPAYYDEAAKRRVPPHGQALELLVETVRDGKVVREPAGSWMREVKTKKPPAGSFAWVFAGSRTMPDGTYAADVTGQVVSVVNFDYSVIDVPQVASSANETLEWEYNPDKVPAKGTKVTLVIRLAGEKASEADTARKRAG